MNSIVAPRPKPQVEEGVWVVIFGELSVFTLMFVTFLYYRSVSPELYEVSKASLHDGLGALNTIILLTSSYFVATAVAAIRDRNEHRFALRQILGALGCGVAFVTVKAFEYGSAFHAGINVLSNEFFMFYFIFTGIHLMHLLVGMALLGAIALQLRHKLAAAGEVSDVLVGFATSFWHMLDIVWLVLFPLLYLLN